MNLGKSAARCGAEIDSTQPWEKFSYGRRKLVITKNYATSKNVLQAAAMSGQNNVLKIEQ